MCVVRYYINLVHYCAMSDSRLDARNEEEKFLLKLVPPVSDKKEE
jgi:hypothetical protein